MTPRQAPAGLSIRRDAHGVPHVEAASVADAWWGQGDRHAKDRGMQMLLMRILGRAQAALLLDPSDAMVEVDRFFLRMNWGASAAEELAQLPEKHRAALERYSAGVNAALAEGRPWELALLGVRPGKWVPGDTVLLARMIGYLTLAQSQGEMERLLVEMVQAGVGRPLLEELFPGVLDGLDEELIKKITLGDRMVPDAVRWLSPAPRMMASNNWVVHGSRTASGLPLLANDPHLEVNRLPNVWYELGLRANGRTLLGATMPGIPGVLIGRNDDLAWGATYAFMDATDSWIEEVQQNQVRRGDRFERLTLRKEKIKRKKGKPVEVVFYEHQQHGVLDVPAGAELEDGFYLATRWSGSNQIAAGLAGVLDMWTASTVGQGMDRMGRLSSAFNWVLADKGGNIGYQMSGLLPRRRTGASGFVPLPGWDPANDWQGFVPVEQLPRCVNPEQGFFTSANNDLNAWGKARAITVSMGDYRARRIAEVLGGLDKATPADMKKLQLDRTSLQARAFMEVLRPLLPATPRGETLRAWDCGYETSSTGATLFEGFYRALWTEVFGRTLGPEVCAHLLGETGIFADFFAAFDRVLLAPRSGWLGSETREALWRRVAARALEATAETPWGDGQQVVFQHLVFGGKLPRWLGFDRGPHALPGGRGTVQQGQIYRSGGRTTSFAPSFRMVVDLATPGLESVLAGGPSDRRFSKWYTSELPLWLEGGYKRVS